MLPKNIKAQINKSSFKPHEIFKVIQQKAKVSDKQMYRTFNMGIGMVLIVEEKIAEKIAKLLEGKIIGKIVYSKKTEVELI